MKSFINYCWKFVLVLIVLFYLFSSAHSKGGGGKGGARAIGHGHIRGRAGSRNRDNHKAYSRLHGHGTGLKTPENGALGTYEGDKISASRQYYNYKMWQWRQRQRRLKKELEEGSDENLKGSEGKSEQSEEQKQHHEGTTTPNSSASPGNENSKHNLDFDSEEPEPMEPIMLTSLHESVSTTALPTAKPRRLPLKYKKVRAETTSGN